MMYWLIRMYTWVRNKLNPIRLPAVNHPVWSEVRDYDMDEFSRWVNKFPYKSDKLNGLWDRTYGFDHFIDETVEYGRDCDEWARMWLIWSIWNNYEAHEVIVANRSIRNMKPHMVTIITTGPAYYLCDYKAYGPFEYPYDLLNSMAKRWSAYSEDSLWVVNDFKKKVIVEGSK